MHKEDKELQRQCLRIISTVSLVKLHCCYAVNMVLTVTVIAVSVALSDFHTSMVF
ncbi:hypothetical protein LEMLEM_LOCUS13036 [Lemmus lemmus]